MSPSLRLELAAVLLLNLGLLVGGLAMFIENATGQNWMMAIAILIAMLSSMLFLINAVRRRQRYEAATKLRCRNWEGE